LPEVVRCIEEGLVGGEGPAVDASPIKSEKGIQGEKGLPRSKPGSSGVLGWARRRCVRRILRRAAISMLLLPSFF
jgi:hypothetical protein